MFYLDSHIFWPLLRFLRWSTCGRETVRLTFFHKKRIQKIKLSFSNCWEKVKKELNVKVLMFEWCLFYHKSNFGTHLCCLWSKILHSECNIFWSVQYLHILLDFQNKVKLILFDIKCISPKGPIGISTQWNWILKKGYNIF